MSPGTSEYHFDDGSDYKLEVQVWDWDLIGSNDFLGAMAFPLPFLGQNAMAVDGGTQGWFKLLDKKQAHSWLGLDFRGFNTRWLSMMLAPRLRFGCWLFMGGCSDM